MTRIASFAANQTLVQFLQRNHSQLNDYNIQLATGKIAQKYSSIAFDTQRLVTSENRITMLDRYVRDNEVANIRLNTAEIVMGGVETTVKDVRTTLKNYKAAEKTADTVSYVQDWAFRTMTDLQAYLNSASDGRYIFGGSKVSTPPVDLGINTLADFQARYDGLFAKYPTTRDAHIASFDISQNDNVTDGPYVDASNWLSFTQDDDGSTFTSGSGTITASSDMFSNVIVGGTIVVSGTVSGTNDGRYTVQSVSADGTSVTVDSTMFTDEAVNDGVVTEPAVGATITLADASTIAPGASGNLAFTNPGTISAGTGASLTGISVGETISIAGSASNDGSYTVTANDGTNLTVTANTAATVTLGDDSQLAFADFGDLTFDRDANTLTSAIAGSLAGLAVGESFTVAGSTQNDGSYTVSANDGTTVTIETNKLTDEGNTAGTAFLDYTVGSEVAFDTGAGTVTAQDYAGAAIAGAFSGLQVGDSFVVANSTSNNGTYTVGSISADGSAITVDAGTPLALTENVSTDGVEITTAARGFAYMVGTELVFDDQGAAGGGDDTLQILNQTTGTPDTSALNGITAGMTVEVSGGTAYDGFYLVSAVDQANGTLTFDASTPLNTGGIAVTETPVSPAMFALKSYAVSGTVTSGDNYYQGDQILTAHRVEEGRTIDIDVTAIDPAFEKVMRALGIVAQGEFGTAGGLDQNWDRLNDAIYLLDDALGETRNSTPPYGTEEFGSVGYVMQGISFDQLVIRQTNTRLGQVRTNFANDTAKIEDIDQLDVITRLLTQQRSVEASYQALARVQTLSLSKFLPA